MKFPVSILAALLVVTTNATADSPNINHQHAESLFDAMKAYQDGERKQFS
ncbi:c-type cytochrome [Moritella yayanosii]|uniref:Cytochrome c553 n=1 Tax=Moritella yayanosii TaxID=69539 RepID=A0A330LLS1_9GAMM